MEFCKREKIKEAHANRAIVVCFLKRKGGNYEKDSFAEGVYKDSKRR